MLMVIYRHTTTYHCLIELPNVFKINNKGVAVISYCFVVMSLFPTLNAFTKILSIKLLSSIITLNKYLTGGESFSLRLILHIRLGYLRSNSNRHLSRDDQIQTDIYLEHN